MSPFIKFSEEKQSAAGTDSNVVFVNADHILKAIYFAQIDELHINLTSEPNRMAYKLKGQEAKDAMDVLRKL